ncbi:MAG TPA: DUF2141 domain-containing protein [Terracidiphilus sp.]|nr:DUF2141 domain-containing protein [Terracidiphilus sp.]
MISHRHNPTSYILRVLWFALAILFGSLAPGVSQSPSPATITLSGQVAGATGKHTVYVALWDAAGFLTHPVQQVRFDPPNTPAFHFQVQPGRWALSAYEDSNGNGVLDMGMFGPKEPSGFWHPFHAWRKPRFDDVAVQIDHDTTGADIKLDR